MKWLRLVVFKPKTDGDKRPIGLTMSLMRIWGRFRRTEAAEREAAHD